MPKLSGISVDDVNKTLHGFQYTNVSIDKLGATEYTLVQMVCDQSGSVSSFKAALEGMLSTSVDACKKSPRANNLLYRTTAFNSNYGTNVNIVEVHGFTPLDQVNPSQFSGSLSPNGGTPLFDATLEAVDALYHFGNNLYKQKFLCNAILFILTDGEENASTRAKGAVTIKETITRMKQENILESLRTILIGVNDSDPAFKAHLEAFRRDAGLDEYISIGDVSTGKLAKLAQFVSQSVSSQSQAIGTGGGSQPINFTF